MPPPTDAPPDAATTGTWPPTELVVLVDEDNRELGNMGKAAAHGADTPLHRGFSCYVLDRGGRVLATRRAVAKRSFGGLWTNSVCGHPGPGEHDHHAVARRAQHELGLAVAELEPALPHYRYRAEAAGLVENEICPVYLAVTAHEPMANPDEVADHAWLPWEQFLERSRSGPAWSPWCREQAEQLQSAGVLAAYRSRWCGG